MKWLKQTFLALFSIFVLISCEYEFIEIAKPQPPDPNDTNNPPVDILFSTQIEPIFSANACTNCHGSGASLDLTTGNAYSSITSNGLVVPGEPENSDLYNVPGPTGSHFKKYTTTDADLVYLWIYQGALDN